MFGGEPIDVTLECHTSLIGPIIDRFGKEVEIIPLSEALFRARFSVCVSDPFIGWVIGLGPGVRVVEPASLIERFQAVGQRLKELYP